MSKNVEIRFLRSRKRDGKVVEHKDYYISKCGECPEVISGLCIRKKVLIDKDKLYEKCPLPVFGNGDKTLV